MSLATTFQSLDADASATLTQALTAKLRAITGEEDQTDILVRDAGNTPPDAVHRLRHGSPALHTPQGTQTTTPQCLITSPGMNTWECRISGGAITACLRCCVVRRSVWGLPELHHLSCGRGDARPDGEGGAGGVHARRCR